MITESILVPVFVLGLISSVVTEILKIFPVLSKTDERKKMVAFVVSLGISTAWVFSSPEYNGMNAFTLVLGAISASFTIYKSIVQVIRKPKPEVN